MKVITSAALFCTLAAQAVHATLSAASVRAPAKGTHKEVALFPARKRGLQLAATKKENPSAAPEVAKAATAPQVLASDDDSLGDANSPLDQQDRSDNVQQAVAARQQVAAADFGGVTAAPQDADFGGATAAPQDTDAGAEEIAPVLPAISAMTGSASETIKGINSQASILEARVAQVQTENEARMARQKAVFEQKLQEQDRKNRAVKVENEKISEEIKELKQGNLNMRKRAQELQEENKFKRTELKTLREKLTVAGDFIVKSLKNTDDKKAKELAVLQAPQPVSFEEHRQVFSLRRTTDKEDEHKDGDSDDENDREEADDDQDSDGDDDDAASLLAVAATVRKATVESMEESQLGQMADVEAELSGVGVDGAAPAATNPRDLINVLSSGIESLTKQEHASEAKLKTLFLNRFMAGTKTHSALLTHQKQLNATRASLLSIQSKLQVATSHLDATRGKLEQELHGLGSFLQHLAHLALTPAQDAPGLLKALPNKITVKGTDDSVADQSAGLDKGDDK